MANVRYALSGGTSGFGGNDSNFLHTPAQSPFTMAGVNGSDAWAEDHGGTLNIRVDSDCGPLSASVAVGQSFVKSNEEENFYGEEDQHVYPGGEVDAQQDHHTLGPCTPLCPPPGVFGKFIGYNEVEVNQGDNDFGQPKLQVVLARDYTHRRADPWNLAFNFRFSGPGAGVFDNASPDGPGMGNPLLRFQVATSSAIVYYHRPAGAGYDNGNGRGWHEPPNVFNPFWRATLAPPDYGKSPAAAQKGELLDRSLLNAGFPAHADVLSELYDKGFRGLQ
jgi:hypothetical protein